MTLVFQAPLTKTFGISVKPKLSASRPSRKKNLSSWERWQRDDWKMIKGLAALLFMRGSGWEIHCLDIGGHKMRPRPDVVVLTTNIFFVQTAMNWPLPPPRWLNINPVSCTRIGQQCSCKIYSIERVNMHLYICMYRQMCSKIKLIRVRCARLIRILSLKMRQQ